MDALDLLIYVAPIMGVVLAIVLYFNLKMNQMARKYEDYRLDRFRQDIEKQIAELAKELTINENRFNSVNHLLIDAQNSYLKNILNVPAGTIGETNRFNFFNNIGVNPASPIDDYLVFVLTPFNEKYNSQYETIKKVVNEFGFKCSKGDDSNLSNNILGHIVHEIQKSRMVIANISGRNPNVFYELGIAHALGKPVVIVSESLADIPFDVNSNRIMAFDDELDLSNKLKKWFVHALAKHA